VSENVDPYRAPESASVVPAASPEPSQLRAAGKGRRFLTFLVDYFGQVAFMMLVLIPVAVVSPAFANAVATMNKLQEIGLGIVTMLVYYVLFEGLWGRTLGKLVCGTRVVDEGGLRPRFTQVLGRSFARLIPFEAFSLLFAADDDPRGWHDTLPKTRVVRTR
jgi:uncharacterized RDD family membrane protein YckC